MLTASPTHSPPTPTFLLPPLLFNHSLNELVDSTRPSWLSEATSSFLFSNFSQTIRPESIYPINTILLAES